MRFFQDTTKTEAAFYLRFDKMSISDKNLLLSFYHITDEMALFSYIKKFWNVHK